jgi:hypothetical protein
MELAIVLAGTVLCFYFSSVSPHGAGLPSSQAAVQNLMQQMSHEPRALDDVGREIYRQHYGD